MHSFFLQSNNRARRANSSAPRSVEVPFFKWNPWALKLMALSQPADRGLGDVIRREIGWKGEPKFEAWFGDNFGKICQGGWTVEMVNERWPLPA